LKKNRFATTNNYRLYTTPVHHNCTPHITIADAHITSSSLTSSPVSCRLTSQVTSTHIHIHDTHTHTHTFIHSYTRENDRTWRLNWDQNNRTQTHTFDLFRIWQSMSTQNFVSDNRCVSFCILNRYFWNAQISLII